MPSKIVRVRDADGREFDAVAVDVRRHGWEVIDDPQPEPETQHLADGDDSVETADAVDKAIDAGEVDWTPPTEEPTQTPADVADEPPANPADRKKNTHTKDKAAVIEPAPTSEGIDR